MPVNLATEEPQEVTWDTQDDFVESGSGNIEFTWLILAVAICAMYFVLVILSWIYSCCKCCKRRRESKKKHIQMMKDKKEKEPWRRFPESDDDAHATVLTPCGRRTARRATILMSGISSVLYLVIAILAFVAFFLNDTWFRILTLFLVNLLQSALSIWVCFEVKRNISRARQLYSIYTWVPISVILFVSIKLIWGIVWYINRSEEDWQKDEAWQYIPITEYVVIGLDALWICLCSYVFVTHANKEIDKDLSNWKPWHREHRRKTSPTEYRNTKHRKNGTKK